jgi:3-deoxy-7-phosphoheptulonate synthase
MIVRMTPGASEEDVSRVVRQLESCGGRVRRSGTVELLISADGGSEPAPSSLLALAGVASVEPGSRVPPSPLRRELKLGGGVTAGGRDLLLIAGPCSVESEDMLHEVAAAVAASGGRGLRAGAYKPRTSPYAFQGLGEEGLWMLRRAADAHGLLVASEILDAGQLPLMAEICDILQVGARNMHNTVLLRELGTARRPVLLKRGMAATVEEWLGAAEYVAAHGNPRVILCERGIRTFETATRNTLDLSAIPLVKERSPFPVLADPSHGTGRRPLVPAMARAAVAAGADGVLVEVHPDPERALSDGAQSLDLDDYLAMAASLGRVAAAVDRSLPEPTARPYSTRSTSPSDTPAA